MTRHLIVDTRGRARPGHWKPCGTRAAYRRHQNHGEVPDQACCDAQAAYQRDRRRAKAGAQ